MAKTKVMGQVKSIGTIIRQLYPMMPAVRSYIKLCKKYVKHRQCAKCEYKYACDFKKISINKMSGLTGTATAQKIIKI